MENGFSKNRRLPKGYDSYRHILVLDNNENYSLKDINLPPAHTLTARTENFGEVVSSRRQLLKNIGTIGIGAVIVVGVPGAAYRVMRGKEAFETDEPDTNEQTPDLDGEVLNELDTYIVQEGDNLWSIVKDNYPQANENINVFIESNIRNTTAEDYGREKEDLRPDDELVIDPNFEVAP